MNGDFSFYGVSVFLFGIGNMDFVIKGQLVVQDISVNVDVVEQIFWMCCKKVLLFEDCKLCLKLFKVLLSKWC